MNKHKIRIKMRNDSRSLNFGRHYKFLVDYYFREIDFWVITRKEIDEVAPRMKDKLDKYPRNSGFYA